jgi:hypothetical protein
MRWACPAGNDTGTRRILPQGRREEEGVLRVRVCKGSDKHGLGFIRRDEARAVFPRWAKTLHAGKKGKGAALVRDYPLLKVGGLRRKAQGAAFFP